NGMDHPARLVRECGDAIQLVTADDERLLTEDVQAALERLTHQRTMARRRRADVDEVEAFAREQVPRRLVPARPRQRRGGKWSARGIRIVGGDDRDIATPSPGGDVDLTADVSETDDGSAQHSSAEPVLALDCVQRLVENGESGEGRRLLD